MENKALEGLVIINGRDIWKEYGVFLTEERRGGRENLAAIMAPAKTKGHVGVNIRERDGVKYSRVLSVANEERDVTLHVALVAGTRAEWLARYRAFISFLKKGDGGVADGGASGAGAVDADVLCEQQFVQAADVSVAGGGAGEPVQGDAARAGAVVLTILKEH